MEQWVGIEAKKKKKKIESLREFYQLSFDNDTGSFY